MQILAVIKKHGYTLEQVATMLGITKGSLSATINGSPNVRKLIDIAQKIGCSPAEFFADWYENEGKEQQKPEEVEQKQPEQPAQNEHTAPADDQPFGKDEAPKQEPPLQPVAAFLCPHCNKAVTIGLMK